MPGSDVTVVLLLVVHTISMLFSNGQLNDLDISSRAVFVTSNQ